MFSEYVAPNPKELTTEPQSRRYKDGLPVALSAMAGKDDVDVLLKLFQEKAHGGSRLFFLKKLLRYKHSEKVLSTIRMLRDDKDLTAAIKRAGQ